MFRFLLLASLSLSAYADDWSTADKALGATALTFELVDMGQTISISHSCHEHGAYVETNPISGTCPKVSSVVQYFTGSILTAGFIADVLPDPYRKLFLTGAIIAEASYVNHNYKMGIGVRF